MISRNFFVGERVIVVEVVVGGKGAQLVVAVRAFDCDCWFGDLRRV